MCLPVCLFMFFMRNRDNCGRNYPIALYFDDYPIKMYLIWYRCITVSMHINDWRF